MTLQAEARPMEACTQCVLVASSRRPEGLAEDLNGDADRPSRVQVHQKTCRDPVATWQVARNVQIS